ncbi:MAG: hypothetical protein E5X32_22650 [Mesorhizobium sp.]|nr:MAG: hypothetical protein E5X32_22650 [Mesorhizobium sp.]
MLLPEGAGAPLLLPSSRRPDRGRGGQGDKSEGDHPPEAKPKGRRRSAHAGSASILHGARPEVCRRKDGETDLSPCWGEGAGPSFPLWRLKS